MGLDTLRRQLLAAQPAGIVGREYVGRHARDPVRVHRTLWARNHPRIPRALWWPIQGAALARWMLAHATQESHRWVERVAPAIEEAEGIPRADQFEVVRSLALRHAIHPRETYELGLYRPERTGHWADYVYDRESGAYNEWCSTRFTDRQAFRAGLATLSNKSRLTALSADWGIGSPVTLLRLPASAESGLARIERLVDQEQELFLKPERGSAGQGALVLRFHPESPEGFALRSWDSLEWMNTGAREHLAKQLRTADYLVQQRLQSDPRFRRYTPAWDLDVVTLRIVTNSRRSGRAPVWHALMELPRPPSTEHLVYSLLPIDPETGVVQAPYLPVWARRASAQAEDQAAQIVGSTVEGWEAIVAALGRGHSHLEDVAAISWDVALTARGPVLLEGNSSFALVRPQAIRGPLLRDRV